MGERERARESRGELRRWVGSGAGLRGHFHRSGDQVERPVVRGFQHF